MMKSPQDTAPFPFLRATAFRVGAERQLRRAQDAAERRRKGREQQRAEQSPAEPCGALATGAAAAAAAAAATAAAVQHRRCSSRAAPPLPEPPSAPVPSCAVRPRKRVPDLIQGPVRSHQALSCPCFPVVFGLGKRKVKPRASLTRCLWFLMHYMAQHEASCILPLRNHARSCLGEVFLFSGEYPSVGKTLCFVHSY